MAYPPATPGEVEKRRAYFREWARAHPLSREQKERNKIRAKQRRAKIYPKKNRVAKTVEEKRAEWRKRRARRDPKKVLAEQRAFHRKNPDYRKNYKKALLRTPRGLIEARLRSRVHQALTGHRKTASTFELLGCSLDQLKSHLESLFVLGMTWQNRGEWHIDHIRPISSFDLIVPEQQRCCFHYTNLQPLWKADNLRKSDKYQHEL